MKITKESLSLRHHDQGNHGIRYKLRVDLGVRVPNKKTAGAVMDVNHILYNAGFKYAYYPSVEIEGRKTVFYYFFSDVDHAHDISMSLTGTEFESAAVRKYSKRWADEQHACGMPAFISPYYYPEKKKEIA